MQQKWATNKTNLKANKTNKIHSVPPWVSKKSISDPIYSLETKLIRMFMFHGFDFVCFENRHDFLDAAQVPTRLRIFVLRLFRNSHADLDLSMTSACKNFCPQRSFSIDFLGNLWNVINDLKYKWKKSFDKFNLCTWKVYLKMNCRSF